MQCGCASLQSRPDTAARQRGGVQQTLLPGAVRFLPNAGSAGIHCYRAWRASMRRSWQFENPADGGADGQAAGRFRVEVAPDRDFVRVSPVGEIDMSTASELAAEMQGLRRS